jgi:hypothetical protein
MSVAGSARVARERVRVLVVGAGPAGLAAATRVLERGGRERFRVRLALLGHHFGGKADSWRDADGRLIDHGQHVVVGFYHQMKGLLRRAGVDVEARLVSTRGHTYIYEPRDGRIHDFALQRNPLHVLYSCLGFSGLTGAEKRNVARFILGNLTVFLGGQGLEQFDDICFTSWCLANGLAPSIVRTESFKMSRTGQLNWPNEISAYSMLKAMKTIGRDYRTAEYGFPDGGMSERFWEPVVAHFGRLGGEVEMMKKLVALRVAGGRVVAVEFAKPDSAGHDLADRDPGRSRYEDLIPIVPGTVEVDRDFDYVISAIPATAFQDLNRGDEAFWAIPELARVRKIRGIVPMALQIWHREPVTRRYRSVITGLEGPLCFVLDNKHIIREYRYDPRYGSVLYFVGQETGYEHWSDREHLDLCLANLGRLPGFERIDRAGILHWQVIRNRSVDKLYFNAEPGVQKFRPKTRTSLANLMMAGDWVRTDLDFPCMESAVRSGLAAADAVVRSAR